MRRVEQPIPICVLEPLRLSVERQRWRQISRSREELVKIVEQTLASSSLVGAKPIMGNFVRPVHTALHPCIRFILRSALDEGILCTPSPHYSCHRICTRVLHSSSVTRYCTLRHSRVSLVRPCLNEMFSTCLSMRDTCSASYSACHRKTKGNVVHVQHIQARFW